jgi:hypothetical protein
MAQVIGLWENLKEDDYTEGPFVVAPINGPGDCRVEVFMRGRKCPVLPDQTIYNYFKRHSCKLRGEPSTIGPIVDALNVLWADGIIGANEHGTFIMLKEV